MLAVSRHATAITDGTNSCEFAMTMDLVRVVIVVVATTTVIAPWNKIEGGMATMSIRIGKRKNAAKRNRPVDSSQNDYIMANEGGRNGRDNSSIADH